MAANSLTGKSKQRDRMLLKFPQKSNNASDNTFISLGGIPFAKHNIVTKSTGRQVGFLTEHSLIFIIQGKKFFYFGAQTVCINSGELILLKRGIYTISEFIPADGCFEALIIFIPDKFLNSIAFEYKTVTTKQKEAPYIILKTNSFLEQFKSQYLGYFVSDLDGKEKLLQLKLHELFVLLQNSTSKQGIADFLSSCINKESIDIEYIVKAHLFQPLSIEDYAKLCMRSLASFKRDFSKKFSTSPKQWINRQRISYASCLLTTTNKPVSQIAFECGFESTSHFIYLFKKQTGYTPQKMRAKVDTF